MSTRHFTPDGLCTCGCHGDHSASGLGRIKHIMPCCHPPKKLQLDRDSLCEWLKPFMYLRDVNKTDGLYLRASGALVDHLVHNRDIYASPDLSERRFFGFEVKVHDFGWKPDEMLLGVYQRNHLIELRELTHG